MDNDMMQQMMQMMMQNQMQNQMMMQQMMMMQMNPQQNAITEQQVEVNSGGDVGAYLAEIEKLKSELEAMKAQLSEYQETIAEQQAQMAAQADEISALKADIATVEAHEGQPWQEIAGRAYAARGDDYYEDMRQEMEEKGMTAEEKKQAIKDYMDSIEENPYGKKKKSQRSKLASFDEKPKAKKSNPMSLSEDLVL